MFSLWWLVALLVAVEVLFLIFLVVKKARSKRPKPIQKTAKKKAETNQYGDVPVKND